MKNWKEILKEHVCRFNDGEQTCECYKEAIRGLQRSMEEMVETLECYCDNCGSGNPEHCAAKISMKDRLNKFFE